MFVPSPDEYLIPGKVLIRSVDSAEQLIAPNAPTTCPFHSRNFINKSKATILLHSEIHERETFHALVAHRTARWYAAFSRFDIPK